MINAKDAAWLSWRITTRLEDSEFWRLILFAVLSNVSMENPTFQLCAYNAISAGFNFKPDPIHSSLLLNLIIMDLLKPVVTVRKFSQPGKEKPVWESHILIPLAFNIDFKRQWPIIPGENIPEASHSCVLCRLCKYVWLGQTKTLNTGFVLDVALHKIKLF